MVYYINPNRPIIIESILLNILDDLINGKYLHIETSTSIIDNKFTILVYSSILPWDSTTIINNANKKNIELIQKIMNDILLGKIEFDNVFYGDLFMEERFHFNIVKQQNAI